MNFENTISIPCWHQIKEIKISHQPARCTCDPLKLVRIKVSGCVHAAEEALLPLKSTGGMLRRLGRRSRWRSILLHSPPCFFHPPPPVSWDAILAIRQTPCSSEAELLIRFSAWRAFFIYLASFLGAGSEDSKYLSANRWGVRGNRSRVVSSHPSSFFQVRAGGGWG